MQRQLQRCFIAPVLRECSTVINGRSARSSAATPTKPPFDATAFRWYGRRMAAEAGSRQVGFAMPLCLTVSVCLKETLACNSTLLESGLLQAGIALSAWR